MSPSPSTSEPTFLPWARHLRSTIALVVGVTLVRLAYLAWWCPYTLAEDEAFYWLWTKFPEWSYYSKGPGVAWVIRLGTLAFGDTELGVRAPAAISIGVAALFIGLLARDLWRDGRVAFVAAMCFLCAPAFQVSALVMTIDAPFVACVAAMLFFAWRGLRAAHGPSLALAGAAFALGFLMKYTMALLLPGLLGFALASRAALQCPRHPPRWIAASCAVALLGIVPIAIWNAQHDWPTVRHLIGHLGLPGGDVPVRQGAGGWRYSPTWTLELVGLQLVLAGPIFVLAMVELVRSRPRAGMPVSSTPGAHMATDHEHSRVAVRYLAWMGAPILLFYVLVSFATKTQGNWTLGAFVPLAPLAASAIVRAMDALPAARAHGERRGGLLAIRALWHTTLVVGVVMALGIARLDLLARAFESARGTPWGARAIPPSLRIPLGRVSGAHEMATHIAELIDRTRNAASAGAGPPLIITSHYGVASQLAFYLPGRPVVCCASAHIGGRETQFDYWAQTRLDNTALEGHDAVLIGPADGTAWRPFFERLEEGVAVRGDPKRDRAAFIGRKFQGFSMNATHGRGGPPGT